MLRVLGAPTDLPGCVLWLDAQDAASITKDGAGKVSQWSDKSGNAKHAVQATPGDQPTYSAAGFGGFPCVDWGAGEVPSRRLVTPNVTYGLFTVFLVGTANAGTTGYIYVHNVYSGLESEYWMHGGQPAAPQIHARRGGGTSARDCNDFSDGRRRVATRYFGGLNSNNGLRLDGLQSQIIERLAGNPGTTVVSAPMYIGNANVAVAPHRGVIAEFIVFDRMLSEGEMVLVEQYLAKKWGIAVTGVIASPLEVPSCAMWFDSSQGVTLDGSNNVAQWGDLSGNARHITQNAPSQRPGYTAENPIFGGKPSVDWSQIGASIYLQRSAADNLAQPLTVLTCGCASNSLVTNVGYFVNATGADFSFQRLDARWQFFNGAGALLFGPPPAGKAFTATFRAVPTTRECSVTLNRQVVARGGTGTNQMLTLRLGSMYDPFGAQNWNGSVAEFLVYQRRLTDGEHAQVEAYLRRKFDI